MEQAEILSKVDALIDESAGLVIRAGRADNALGDAVHANAMAWRALVLSAAGIADDGLAVLERRLRDT